MRTLSGENLGVFVTKSLEMALWVPESIKKEDLTGVICSALSLTGADVVADDLDKCHRLKAKMTVLSVNLTEGQNAIQFFLVANCLR